MTIANSTVKNDIANILVFDSRAADLATVGGKGASLARLAQAGFPVPGGFFVTTAAYERFIAYNELQPALDTVLHGMDNTDQESLAAAWEKIQQLFESGEIPNDIAEAIRKAYLDLGDSNPAVAVRSSATAEDLPELSFAGQQETYLNVRTAKGVLLAVRRCWASLWTPRAIDYRLRHRIGTAGEENHLAIAVVVQLLVPADAAGILFTANPLNGRRDQLVVSAAWGLGEAVVGGLVTPDTLTINKETRAVVERQTADKEVMTIRTADGTAEANVPHNKRHAPVLDDRKALRLAQIGLQIEDLYQMPMDIEWALYEGRFAILQARPITALPKAQPDPPMVWELPPGVRMAVRNNIVEMMAAPLTPLFATLGLAAVNRSMSHILADFFGRTDIMPPEIIITVNQFAYYNGTIPLASIARILWGSVGIARRMFSGAVERWTQKARPAYVALVAQKQASNWQALAATDLLAEVRLLSEAAIDAYGALVSGVIPAAWISEGLFTLIYNGLIKWKDDPEAAVFLLGFDSTPTRAEKALYELTMWARSEPDLAHYINNTPTEQLVNDFMIGDRPASVGDEPWREWRTRLMGHLQLYGHSVYNLDFANPTPADDPAPLLELCKMFISGQGGNPHLRQEAAVEKRERLTKEFNSQLGPIRRRLFNRFLKTAQRYAPLREDGLADVGLSYPLLRQILRELGRRFVVAGITAAVDDIFWLTENEVEQAAAELGGFDEGSLGLSIATRKNVVRAAALASPPRALPVSRLFGSRYRTKGKLLTGVGASPGQVTGTARVLRGPEDFDQLGIGDILVANITTPAWTPLFVRAAAVVTDVGGPLSHGSIVAREYGIPAVLGTKEATSRIRSGDLITVDGDTGQVFLDSNLGEHSRTYDPNTGEWNDSYSGDYLWSNANLSEALPEVMTPSSWSLWRIFHEETIPVPLPSDVPFAGNIAGRAYANVSLLYSVYRLGDNHEQALNKVQQMLGRVPLEVELPVIPFSRWQMVGLIPASLRWQRRSKQLVKQLTGYLQNAPERCRQLRQDIWETDSAAELNTIWQTDLRPALLQSFWMLRAAMKYFSEQGIGLRKEVDALVDKDDANALLSNFGGSELASLGPLRGLRRLARREISREQYLDRYGHRGPNECELFTPLPAEDPLWLDEQLALLDQEPISVDQLLSRQNAVYEAAVKQLQAKHPRQANRIIKRLDKLARGSQLREAARSEMIRTARLVRDFALRAAEFTQSGEDIFFLTLDEMLASLAGVSGGIPFVLARREAYKRNRALPPYPTLIRGPFDPLSWSRDSKRRVDYFDGRNNRQQTRPIPSQDMQTNAVTGFPGATGVVEGNIRVLNHAAEGCQLQQGEILVTVTTNIGWTPLFPRAAAIVTDVGAPLSHAAIVARELGIPAVVGCGDATARLHTGDRVRVDGGQGRIEIIS